MDAQNTLEYRRALGAFPTGVVLVTTELAGGEQVGLVANSFTSVSLTPPKILWCLGNQSDRGVYFRDATRFAVNILGAEAEATAAAYASRGRHHLDPADLDLGEPGFPAVRGALTVLHCRASERLPLADHLIIVGEVESFRTRAGDGLTYFRGRFGRAATPQETA